MARADRKDSKAPAPSRRASTTSDRLDSMSTMRPMATQAVFRPHFDDSDGDSVGTADTEPRGPRDDDDAGAVADPPARRRAGGDPAGARDRPAVRADDQSRCRRVETVLLELRAPGRPVVDRRQGAVGGLVPALRQRVFVPAATGSRRHGRRPVRDQGLHRARRTGLGVPGRRPQRQRTARRAQGSGAFRRRRSADDRDGRASVPRRGDAPGDREDLQLRRASRPARQPGRLHRDGVRRRKVAQAGQGRQAAGRRGHRLHARDPARAGLSAFHRPVPTTTSSPRTS